MASNADITERMPKYEIITDGSCLKNPGGPGGWACIIRHRGNEQILHGFELETTNNRMELQAAIAGLENIKPWCQVVVLTDSEYLRKGISEWVPRWKRRGWTTGEGKPVKNKDLWLKLDALCKLNTVEWKWIRGHDGHSDNERCDKLARRMAEYAKATSN